MKVNKVKRKAHKLLKEVLHNSGHGGVFEVEFIEAVEDMDDESVHMLFSITFQLCASLHTHMIPLHASADFGICINGAGRENLQEVNFGNVMCHLYFDLALEQC